MSRTVRRKHFMKEMLNDNLDLPKDNQQIVRVVSSRGNNLHEVESSTSDDQNFLVSMPTKFRNTVWVKRGDFLIVSPIEEGDKVKAEISRILTPEHIKEFTKQGVWPKKFTKKRELPDNDDEKGEQNSMDNDKDFAIYNINRKPFKINKTNDEESESSSSDENDELE